MCGWGRTGEWFVSSAEGITPDILTTAKGITSAYMPLGLCATTQKIADFFEENYFAHGHTYEAHPMTLAPAVATINEMRRLNLIERSNEMGAYLGEKLHALKPKHPSIGDVRGLGLFWAVELVKDQQKKDPFNTWQEKVDGKPMGVAGLWESWTGAGGEVIMSYTLLTVSANSHALMHRYQQPGNEKRMVVILNEGSVDAWLSARPEKAREFMRAYPANWLTANPIEKKR